MSKFWQYLALIALIIAIMQNSIYLWVATIILSLLGIIGNFNKTKPLTLPLLIYVIAYLYIGNYMYQKKYSQFLDINNYNYEEYSDNNIYEDTTNPEDLLVDSISIKNLENTITDSTKKINAAPEK